MSMCKFVQRITGKPSLMRSVR